MASGDRGIVVGPDGGKARAVGADTYTEIVVGTDTAGAYAVMVLDLIGDEPPPHIHKNFEEAFYVLEGEAQFKMGERIVREKAGAFVLVPRGTPHTFSNPGTTPTRLLTIVSPPGFERFFEEIDGVTDWEKIAAVASNYDVEFPGPPPGR